MNTSSDSQLRFRPWLAFTMGDPAGVGPEVLVRAWKQPELHQICRGVVIGNLEVLQRAARLFAPEVQVVETTEKLPVEPDPQTMPCLDVVSPDACQVQPGTVDSRGGEAAYEATCEATRLALAGVVAGLVTAPLHKAALHAAGHPYPGHTELLAELCGVNEVAMMLYLPPGAHVRGPHGLGVVHVTLHTALRNVAHEVTIPAVLAKIRLVHHAMCRLMAHQQTPRIAVAALNPHAGESGLFGDEEQRIIEPAVRQAVLEGICAAGPFPADTLMVRAVAGDFDAVVAMYHDQGHIALKLLSMHSAVNITLGLPIVRTSVAHGTAFDIAWQGRAQTSGLVHAAQVAARLAQTQG
jgi:4-hydroxythreonine-4-phosphate dehydrogenase